MGLEEGLVIFETSKGDVGEGLFELAEELRFLLLEGFDLSFELLFYLFD